MLVHDTITGFPIADPAIDPLKDILLRIETFEGCPYLEALQRGVSEMILSASGWRKVFACEQVHSRGHHVPADLEETTAPDISPTDSLLTALMALSFADHLVSTHEQERSQAPPATLLIGMDTRHTGPAIADVMTRVLLGMGCELRPVFIAAAPEIMAYSSYAFDSDGFIYISASHNPIGYNGIKFGRDGGVIGGSAAAHLITQFRAMIRDPEQIRRAIAYSAAVDVSRYEDLLHRIDRHKLESLDAYRSLAVATAASASSICNQDQVMSRIRLYAETQGLGIVGELNGSARSRTIDESLFAELGISLRIHHGTPREIVHRIVPEGKSLDPCRSYLEAAYAEDPRFIFGYVPDNDGDRGNLVYIDEQFGSAHILEAQQVFALSVLSELAFATATLPPDQRLAVVVNGPTSIRTQEIATCFGASVFRSEVGEANSVTLAEELREQGYIVRILGEGSNGGNITHPAKVRDPLNTLFSFIKLLALRDDREQIGLFRLWCERSGNMPSYRDDFTFSDILRTVPVYITTSAFEERAVMKIRSSSHESLKANYEHFFLHAWEDPDQHAPGGIFFDLGIASWVEFNTEGTKEIEGMGPQYRSGKSTGGLRIVFKDADHTDMGFVWLRGSGTEPVLRILADWRGGEPQAEERLRTWHRALVERADDVSHRDGQ